MTLFQVLLMLATFLCSLVAGFLFAFAVADLTARHFGRDERSRRPPLGRSVSGFGHIVLGI